MMKVFETILDKYKIAWEQRDPDLAKELFTANATYHEDPFDRKPMKGRRQIYNYWAAVPRFQKNISFSYRPVFNLAGSNVWGAEWTAAYTKVETGERNTLKGVLFCKLSGRKISKFWEYWHLRGGSPAFTANGVDVRTKARSKRYRKGRYFGETYR